MIHIPVIAHHFPVRSVIDKGLCILDIAVLVDAFLLQLYIHIFPSLPLQIPLAQGPAFMETEATIATKASVFFMILSGVDLERLFKKRGEEDTKYRKFNVASEACFQLRLPAFFTLLPEKSDADIAHPIVAGGPSAGSPHPPHIAAQTLTSISPDSSVF